MTGFFVNNVPNNLMCEFKQDAKENYSNNYCMKIMADHYRSKKSVHKEIEMLSLAVNELFERIEKLEGVPEQVVVEKVFKTFGRGE